MSAPTNTTARARRLLIVAVLALLDVALIANVALKVAP